MHCAPTNNLLLCCQARWSPQWAPTAKRRLRLFTRSNNSGQSISTLWHNPRVLDNGYSVALAAWTISTTLHKCHDNTPVTRNLCDEGPKCIPGAESSCQSDSRNWGDSSLGTSGDIILQASPSILLDNHQTKCVSIVQRAKVSYFWPVGESGRDRPFDKWS